MRIDTADFSGILVPLITPFLKGAVDFESVKQLCEHYIALQADGLIMGGTTGEAAMLTQTEKYDLIAAVVADYGNRLPIIAGISAVSTQVAIEEAKKLDEIGVDGLLILTPPYIKPSQAGIYHHFYKIAEAVTLPIILYNIPYRTGVNITVETMQRLAQLEPIFAVKECGGDMRQLMAIIQNTSLRVFTGEDHLLLAASVLGAVGAISASAHLCLPQMKQVLSQIHGNDGEGAREMFYQILDIIDLCFSEPNPAPIKAILHYQKLIASDEVRPPLMAASQTVVTRYQTMR